MMYNNEHLASPPPAHMGIPPVHIDPKTGKYFNLIGLYVLFTLLLLYFTDFLRTHSFKTETFEIFDCLP